MFVVVIRMKRIIYVTDFGQSVKQKKNRIVICSGNSSREYAVDEVSEIVIMGKGKAITVDAIRLCIERKIPIFFAYANGFPYAAVLPIIVTGTVKRRRAQYAAYNSPLGVEIAKKFVIGKLSNQRNLLRFWAKARAHVSPEVADKLKDAARKINDLIKELRSVVDNSMNAYVRMKLMSIESKAADIYWSCFGLLLKKYVEFPGRVKPNATDPVNSLLNLGYGILARKVFIAILFAGLDPYAGFLHSDKSGKRSLVFDLMEEFRQQGVDRLVMKMFTKRIINPKECIEEGRLKDDVCKKVIKLFEERLEEKVTNIYGEKRTLNEHIHYQARHLGRVLIGTDPEYKPFILPW